jgi:dihydrofolate synthase / folylpolyglutamate synthase
MNYQQTLDYLFDSLPMYHRIGTAAYKADLVNTIKLCDLLDNPQNAFRSVHVAGTNGKGSVSHMLASILQESGLNVGLYTSPHLKDFRERIRVNGKMISKKYVSRFIQQHKAEFEELHLSFFEMTVGLAFHYFREQKVDIALVEVGLGGRLDSTNIIDPVLSVITNISYDHMQFLGDTLEKIAIEKAGIIKPGVPVVIGETQEGTKNIFLQKAASCKAGIVFADSLFSVGDETSGIRYPASGILQNLTKQTDIYKSGRLFLPGIELPLLGKYQDKNILTVISACEVLKKEGIRMDEDQIRNGIRNVILNTGFAGRWQILSQKPLTIADTGHNEAGLIEVVSQISETPHKKLHFVFGVVNDKQIGHILEILPKEATYYFCRPDIPRGLPQDELKHRGNAAGLIGNAYPSVGQALKAARKEASADDLVFIGGSTFVVAEVV